MPDFALRKKYMKKATKAIALFLSLLFILSLFSSCGLIIINKNDTHETKPRETTAKDRITDTDPPIPGESAGINIEFPEPEKWQIRKDEAEKLLEKQVDVNFSGKSVYIIDSVGTLSSPLIENNTYSEALYERNNMLKEKYGLEITVSRGNSDTMLEEFKAAVNSGNTYCDILSVPLFQTSIFIASGLVQNLRSLPFFEASGEYSIPSFDESRLAGNDTYFSIGYGTLSPDDLGCIYFNRTILEKAGIDIYSEVSDGIFTIDRYYEILSSINSGTLSTDKFGIAIASLELSPTKFFETGYKKTLTMNLDTFKAAATDAGRILNILSTNMLTLSEGETAKGTFEAGKAAFMYGSISEITEMSEKKVLFGVIPMPKYNLDSDYKTPVSHTTTALMIASNTQKTDLSSITVSAIHAASYKWLLDSAGLLYGMYYIPDINSLQMIKLIFENPVLDFAAGGRGLSVMYDPLVIAGIQRKAASLDDTLDDIYSPGSLNALRVDLIKYYN